MKAVVLLLPILLAGCASTKIPEPIIRTIEVKVPVPVSCVPDNLPDAPVYPDTDEALRAAPGPDARYQLLIKGRKERIDRLSETEPVILNCKE